MTHKALDMQIKAYDKLTSVQEKTIANTEAENIKMLSELNKRSEELRKKELALAEKEGQIIASQNKSNKLSGDLVQREKKIKELEDAIRHKDSAVKALNTSIAAALNSYKNLGLSVTEKDGKVYVSLEEKLLFKSGSYNIDEKGKAVLLTVAKALNENPDVTIMIEGHTDNVPFNGKGTLKDNWDLSVMRATTIVKILVDEGKVDPKRILAAGRGEHMPINTDNTSEGRQANRRTEIILTPQLSEILKSLE
jgi:chemotaxis protein MotB